MKKNNILLWEGNPPDNKIVKSAGQENKQNPCLTPYFTGGKEPRPAIIVCPGGGFRILAPIEGEPAAQWLNSIGYTSFVLNYRVYPYTQNTAIKDAVRAIRYIRHNAAGLNIDPDRIGMMGFSAGGYLTAFLSTHFSNGNAHMKKEYNEIINKMFTEKNPDSVDMESSELNAAILCYTAVTINREKIIQAGGEAPSPSEIEAISSLKNISANTPPTFLWVSQTDEMVPYRDTLEYAEKLADNDVPFELHIFGKGRHAVGLGKNQPVSLWTDLCEKWLKNLWPER